MNEQTYDVYDAVKQRYIEQQLFQLAPLPITENNYPNGFDIKVYSGKGKATNCLRITAEQMQKIEAVLRGTV
jgi:hypothetical protein